jgi:hypothetical protein
LVRSRKNKFCTRTVSGRRFLINKGVELDSGRMKAILVILTIALLVVPYFLADYPIGGFLARYITIVGTAGTFAGLIYTIFQVILLRKEAKIITATARETKSQILLLMCIADWARGVKVAQEVQIHCRNGKREIAIPRIQELKQILQDIVNASDGEIKEVHGGTAAKHIINLNVIINGFEKDTKSKMSGVEVAGVNKTFEATIDLLTEIQSITKNKG